MACKSSMTIINQEGDYEEVNVVDPSDLQPNDPNDPDTPDFDIEDFEPGKFALASELDQLQLDRIKSGESSLGEEMGLGGKGDMASGVYEQIDALTSTVTITDPDSGASVDIKRMDQVTFRHKDTSVELTLKFDWDSI